MTAPRRRIHARRSGYVLLLVAMLLFGLMALAALTVDIGLARFTQSKMQVAADLAVLEGMRRSPSEASDLVRGLYRDDDDAEDARKAERTVLLEDGLSDLNASARMTFGRFVPDLQLNEDDNEDHGDFVRGTFRYVDPDTNERVRHAEGPDYRRDDFGRNALGTALLARLRRTPVGLNSLDRDDPISSSGDPLPFLFGMGTMIRGADPDDPAVYSPRHHGLTVRATAIADLRPVLVVGAPVPAAPHDRPRATRIALELAAWEALDPTSSLIVDPMTGRVSTGAVEVGWSLPEPRRAVHVGTALRPSQPPTEALGDERWLPLYEQLPGLGERVVAFAHASLSGTALSIELTKLPGGLAGTNASALPPARWPDDLLSEIGAVGVVLARHRTVALNHPADLLTAPVLVR